MSLNLQEKHDIVKRFYKQIKNGMPEPNCVWVAWEWFGKAKVEAIIWVQRHAIYKVIQWTSDRRERILHHKLMSCLDLKVNVYKWKVDNKGLRKARYNDYDDCQYYTGTELFLLCREKVAEETERRNNR